MTLGGNRVAVIVCARQLGGKVLLTSTRGIENKKAISATQDAFAAIGQLSGSDDVGDIALSIQGLPLSCGSVRLWQGRWRVFYRAMGPTLAMVLAPASQNAFSALNILGQVVRVLSSDGKIPEVPIERVQRKYAEVYLSIDSIVSSAGVLTASEALDEAHAVMDSLGAPPGQLVNRRMARHPIPQVSYKLAKRSLSSQQSQLGQLAFSTTSCMAGLKALPGFELPLRLQQEEQPKPKILEDSLPEAAQKSEDPFEDIFGPIKDAEIRGQEAPPSTATSGTATRPLLRLIETWRAEFEGAQVMRCGLDGCVQWVEDAVNDPPCHIRFSLSTAVWTDEQVTQCIRASQRHPLATSIAVDGSGAMVADGASSRVTPTPVLLRYHLPPGHGLVAPLLVNVGVSAQEGRDGCTAVLVGIRIALTQQSHVRMQALNVQLTSPAMFKHLARASPLGAIYSPERRAIHWSLPPEGLTPGGLEVLAAVFKVRASEATCIAAAQEMQAEVQLLGLQGDSLSGVSLTQSFEQSTTRVEKMARWQAQVIARPSALG